MLNKPVVRYTSVVIALALAFINFVACGAKMYQISLDHDHSSSNNSSEQSSNIEGIHMLDGWGNQIPIPFSLSVEMQGQMRQSILSAMRTWEYAVGKRLFLEKGVDQRTGDDFVDLNSSLIDQINGQYLDDNWQKTQKKPQVIATTIWHSIFTNTFPRKMVISTADIRFNFQYYNLGDSYKILASDDRKVVDLESIALHELGHLLGLGHIDQSVDPSSVMKPMFLIGENLSKRKLSRGDIKRIQMIYGCAGSACNIDSTYLAMERNEPLSMISNYSSTDNYASDNLTQEEGDEDQVFEDGDDHNSKQYDGSDGSDGSKDHSNANTNYNYYENEDEYYQDDDSKDSDTQYQNEQQNDQMYGDDDS